MTNPPWAQEYVALTCTCGHSLSEHRWEQDFIEIARPPEPPPYHMEGVRRAYECNVATCSCLCADIRDAT